MKYLILILALLFAGPVLADNTSHQKYRKPTVNELLNQKQIQASKYMIEALHALKVVAIIEEAQKYSCVKLTVTGSKIKSYGIQVDRSKCKEYGYEEKK